MTFTSLELEYGEGDKIVEIGGGSKPLFHPNIDVRVAEGVDIVCDVSKEPLPLQNDTYDGVYGNFVIEHISWKNVKFFIKECYRVVKKGGHVIFITSNTLEQCRKIVEVGDDGFGEEHVCMLFGGQEFPDHAGAHKCGWSPRYACKLFAEAGFSEVKVYEHPALTDMIIEAEK